MTQANNPLDQTTPTIAVVGMHRSGTSATAGLLIGFGLAGPRPDDLVPGDSSNERGHWESHEVQLCNAHLLAARGATTYAPPPITENWNEIPVYESVLSEARQWFTATYSGRPLVMKDPRMCLTLPFWRSALPSPLGAVFVLRDPMDVARSLEARDGIPVLLGLAMWDRYIRSATAGLAGIPTLVVEYDAMLEDPSKASKAVSAFLEDMGIRPAPGKTEDAATRLDPKLRHQGERRDEYDELVRSQRSVLASLAEHTGPHATWTPPPLSPPPAWVDDVLRLRLDYAGAARELHWVKASRAYRLVSSLWRFKGGSPTQLSDPATFEEQSL
jgi:hypothetical protein